MPGPADYTTHDLEIRAIADLSDLQQIVEIQRETWGPDELEIVPAAQLRAVEHAGGQLAGAFRGDYLLGFAYGFLATPHGRAMSGSGLHSHMVAVREEARGLGVGQALKWFQRDWCLERGLNWISWTFDPLQGRNAHLNLEHLGVRCYDYLVDFYGVMSGPLGGGQSSDRLLALWQLDAPWVKTRLLGRRSAAGSQQREDGDATWVLRRAGVGPAAEPVHEEVQAGAPALLIAVPDDVTALLRDQPELAQRWRTALRTVMLPLLSAGYYVAGFHDGAYLVRLDDSSKTA